MKRYSIIASVLITIFAGVVLLAPQADAATCTTTLRYKSTGTCVKQAQELLKARGYYDDTVNGTFSVSTVNATLNFQRAQAISADGVIGPMTWSRLRAPRAVSTYIPSSCKTSGTVLCGSKAQQKLFFMQNGVIKKTFIVRYGGYTTQPDGKYRIHNTVSGTYRVYNKHVNPYSQRYGAGAMPYSVMFNPNMYVHGSADFAKYGYKTASHGCVNIRSLDDAKWIYDNTPIGAKVVIY